MRIFAKKAFCFKLAGEIVNIKPMEFKDVPDWVKDTYLFALAKQEGSVEEIVSKEQRLSFENDGITKEEKELRERAKDLKISNYQRMAIDKLKEKIAEAELKTQNRDEEKTGE